jgi:YVTN family beta-propeller protein
MNRMSVAAAAVAAMTAWNGAGAGEIVAKIPGPDGSWDYASFDPVGHRILVSRGDGVMTVDPATRKLAHISPGKEVNGSIALPDGRLLITNEETNTVTVANGTSGTIEKTIRVGKAPDAAVYDPASGMAIVANHESGDLSVIDANVGKEVARIAVGGSLEFAAVDGNGTLFVNIESPHAAIAVVDTKTMRLKGRYKLAGCEEPSALAYIAPNNLLISACSNGHAVVLDAADGHMINELPIGPHPDAVVYDRARSVAFIATAGWYDKNGEITVLKVTENGVSLSGTIPTERGARTCAEDPATGLLYLPTADYVRGPKGRPKTVAGTFRVLVVDPQVHAESK